MARRFLEHKNETHGLAVVGARPLVKTRQFLNIPNLWIFDRANYNAYLLYV